MFVKINPHNVSSISLSLALSACFDRFYKVTTFYLIVAQLFTHCTLLNGSKTFVASSCRHVATYGVTTMAKHPATCICIPQYSLFSLFISNICEIGLSLRWLCICLYSCVTYDIYMVTSSNGTFSALLAFVRGIHRSPVNSPHKGQWRGALVFYLICALMNSWLD